MSDIDAVADLGIRTLRYPVLWESISPENPEEVDFRWHDERLLKMQQLGIEPIAGLLHHGSGPHYTNLLHPQFPILLAQHAKNVAGRYPWITRYTPINEPMTTARFSCLYGHWYPHHRSERDFCRAMINQCRGIVLAMRAIRAIIPHAKLIQTEDLGKTFSTPLLQYQADYDNERRWLTFDLLLGRVDRSHPWHKIFLSHDISEKELSLFLDEPCPPDTIGINHYLTSDRFLEHRRSHRPHNLKMPGNGRHRYCDLEAVRIQLPAGSTGPEARLREVWDRYHRRTAITEAHHGSTRDEQVRWLAEVWEAAKTLRAEGKDICAVTVWALFGVEDWNTLLTQRNGLYEPGAFDIRGTSLRLTALGRATKAILSDGVVNHPVLDSRGWWHSERRFYRPELVRSLLAPAGTRTILLLRGSGALAQAFVRIAQFRGLDCILMHPHDPSASEPQLGQTLLRKKVWAIVDVTEKNIRQHVVKGLPDRNSNRDIAGTSAAPFQRVGFSCGSDSGRVRSLTIDTGELFGPWDTRSSIAHILRTLEDGVPIGLASNEPVKASYIPDVVNQALDLLIDGESGRWQLVNPTEMSWFAFGQLLAKKAALNTELVRQVIAQAAHVSDPSQSYSVMPTLADALDRFLRDYDPNRNPLQIAAE
ncbi:dTDP-4-dehydrorhamnose reductase [Phyllobacterium sp. 1468]|uniref:dTDP-4-dehydrorhamnose reductase n=1 Tax=Phyllobacterium sp. 1468 TaxID=2817759 RepID=UPI001AE88DDA|nr:dTDP-4-dehydrorhamnose reductase [Phyllobacterium sp. 1468]MDR6635556.1 dTDP-4-dehydrorhamnose reductase [Phyllobacterium sp. 1468]